MKEVERTIDDLCKLIQKKTENCKESYEVNELTELTKALAELITAVLTAIDQISIIITTKRLWKQQQQLQQQLEELQKG